MLLEGMGLKKFVEMPSEASKLENLLTKIGALVTYGGNEGTGTHEAIRLEVLMAAMRIHGYEYATHKPQPPMQGFDFRKLSPKAVRIMNRLTRVLAQYLDKYQQKAKEGVKISMR